MFFFLEQWLFCRSLGSALISRHPLRTRAVIEAMIRSGDDHLVGMSQRCWIYTVTYSSWEMFSSKNNFMTGSTGMHICLIPAAFEGFWSCLVA